MSDWLFGILLGLAFGLVIVGAILGASWLAITCKPGDPSFAVVLLGGCKGAQ
jgi:hypothetical protein